MRNTRSEYFTSDVPSTAGIVRTRWNVRVVPIAVIRHACSITSSAWAKRLCKRAAPPGLGLAHGQFLDLN
jgi:hypothetical protein